MCAAGRQLAVVRDRNLKVTLAPWSRFDSQRSGGGRRPRWAVSNQVLHYAAYPLIQRAIRVESLGSCPTRSR